MKIKTIAEILSEDDDNTKGSYIKKGHQKKGHLKSVAHKTSKSNMPEQKTDKNSLVGQKPARTDSKQPYHANKPSLTGSMKPLRSETNKDVDAVFPEQIDNTYESKSSTSLKYSKRQLIKPKKFNPASPYTPKTQNQVAPKVIEKNTIKSLLEEVKSTTNQSESSMMSNSRAVTKELSNCDDTSIDNLPTALKAYLKTPEQRQAEKEELKANSRLRWLAFYYLSRREHSANELRQKLLAKEQDPNKIEELLKEFSEKGYQSEYRTALMLIREGIRKHRGRLRIKQDFKQRRVAIPANIDELIDMAMEESDAFIDVVSENELVEGVDWLRLAVEARVKKYGEDIPVEPKAKARQLRFLQYRGFKPDIYFQAIQLNLDNLEERF